MISYRLEDYHEELRATVAEFARDVVAPVIGDYYERREFPYEIVARMAKLGLFGLPFPEEYGGMGGDLFAFCLALEELARVDSSVAITLEAAVALGAMPIYRFGSEEQRRRWLPDLCAGERLAAFGLTEPGGGIGHRRRHAHHGRVRRWRVGHRRVEVLHHQRRYGHHLAGDGARHHQGRPGRAGGRGDGTAMEPGSGRRSPPSSCRPGRPASRSDVSTPRWAGAPRTRGNWPSPPAGCPRIICSGSAAGATPSSCRSWTRDGWRSRPWRPAWRQGCVSECLRQVAQREAFGHRLGYYQGIQFKLADMEAQGPLRPARLVRRGGQAGRR